MWEDPTAPVKCPVCREADLVVDWLPATDNSAGRGEVRLLCPACGAVNYALTRERPAGL